MKFVIVLACVLLSSQCGSQPVEYSVVSVYTTQPTTAGTGPTLDIYHQIANNIAERITSPLYRLFGLNSTTTEAPRTTSTDAWDRLEFFDEKGLKGHDVKPTDSNDAEQNDRDVEEVTVQGLNKAEKKPEKLTLYSSLIPTKYFSMDLSNPTVSQDMDANDLSDLEPEKERKGREGPFIFVLEFIGSILQLLWGGFMALFKPPTNRSLNSS